MIYSEGTAFSFLFCALSVLSPISPLPPHIICITQFIPRGTEFDKYHELMSDLSFTINNGRAGGRG